jgi:hypothetical protein
MSNQYNNDNNNNMNNQYNNNNNNNYNENNINDLYNNNNDINNQYNNNIMNNQFNQNMENNNLINYQNNNNNMNNPNFNQRNINPNNQNKNLNSNINNSKNVLMNQNENDSTIYEKIYPYINVNTFRITFITQNGSKKFSIPSSLRNNELYYIADKINNPEFFEYSDVNFIKLFCVNNNNKIFIPNDDNFIGYLNDSQILIEETKICYNSELMVNIFFKSDKEKKITVIIPYNFTVKELINAFFNKNKIAQHNQKYFFFFLDDKALKITDNEINKEGINNGHIINFEAKTVCNDYNYKYLKSNCPGKRINVFLKDKKGKSNLNLVIFAGTLQQIKNFYQELMKYLSQQKIEFEGAPIINYQNKSLELDENNENAFSSYGIRNDFICLIDVKIDS